MRKASPEVNLCDLFHLEVVLSRVFACFSWDDFRSEERRIIKGTLLIQKALLVCQLQSRLRCFHTQSDT